MSVVANTGQNRQDFWDKLPVDAQRLAICFLIGRPEIWCVDLRPSSDSGDRSMFAMQRVCKKWQENIDLGFARAAAESRMTARRMYRMSMPRWKPPFLPHFFLTHNLMDGSSLIPDNLMDPNQKAELLHWSKENPLAKYFDHKCYLLRTKVKEHCCDKEEPSISHEAEKLSVVLIFGATRAPEGYILSPEELEDPLKNGALENIYEKEPSGAAKKMLYKLMRRSGTDAQSWLMSPGAPLALTHGVAESMNLSAPFTDAQPRPLVTDAQPRPLVTDVQPRPLVTDAQPRPLVRTAQFQAIAITAITFLANWLVRS